MKKEVEICPFMSNPEKMTQCIKESCRAYRVLCEDKYETCSDGHCTLMSTFKGICLLIPGDECR